MTTTSLNAKIDEIIYTKRLPLKVIVSSRPFRINDEFSKV